MLPSTRLAVAPALQLAFVLLAVLALGAVDAARAQTVTLLLSQTAIAEDGGEVTVTATLSEAVSTEVTVEVSARAFRSRRRALGQRFTLSANTTLTFAATQTDSSGVVTLTAVDNDTHTVQGAGGMMVQVAGTVSSGTGVTDPDSVTLSITEDDGVGSGTDTTPPSLSATGATVVGDRVTLVFDEPLAANTAITSDHFAYTIGSAGVLLRPRSVSVPGGTTIVLTLQEPVEWAETVQINYIARRDRYRDYIVASALQDVAGNVLIAFLSDDLVSTTPPRVALALTPGAISEDGGTATVTATVPVGRSSPFTVEVAVSPDTGVTLSTNTTLSFAASATESTGSVTIAALNNGVRRPNPEVTVSGTLPGAPSGVLAPHPVTLTVVDDETPARVTLALAPDSIREDGGTAIVTAAVPVGQDTPFTVTVSVSPDSGVRLSANTTLSFAANATESTGTVTIAALDNGVRRPNPPVTVSGTLPGAPSHLLAPRPLTLTVVDDEAPARVILALTPDAISEDAGIATVAATLPLAQDDPFSVEVSVSPDTGVRLSANTTLSFAANATESSGLVTITALDNGARRPNPVVTVSGTLPDSPDDVLPPHALRLTVVDDEALEVSAAPARAWMARFGRMAADHAVLALGERLRGGRRSRHLRLAGQAVSPTGRPRLGPDGGGPIAGVQRTMDGAELLRGSSFHLPFRADGRGPAKAGRRWALWGKGAAGRFDGKDGAVAMDGEAISLVLGADVDWGRVLAGLAVSYSAGEGGFATGGSCTGPRCAGKLESAVLGAYPYLRVRANERLSGWATLGYGAGDMTASGGGSGPPVKTDIAMKMAALGVDGIIVPERRGGGFSLALRSDGTFVRNSWDGKAALPAGEADVRRLRLRLVAAHGFALASHGSLTPSVEVGLRHDGGDAETGAGVELGGALRFANSWGLTLEARVRGLLAHENGDHREWGASASARLNPGSSGRGLSLVFAPAWGAAPGGANGVRAPGDAPRGVAALHGARPAARLEGELGYGFAVLRGRGVLTPYAGLSTGRELRLGWRLKLGSQATLGLAGVRRQAAGDHRVLLSGSLRW